MIKTNKRSKINKKLVLLAALLVVLLATGAWAYQHHKNANKQTGTSSGKINYNPPTKEDTKRADDNKDRIAKQEAAQSGQPQAPTTAKHPVTPTITYADIY